MAATSKFTTSTTGVTRDPPVAALAVTRLDVVLGSIIQLDGRKSFSPDGYRLNFHWSFNQVPIGSEVQTIGVRSIRPNASAVSFAPDKIGLYIVQLVVDDGELTSDPITATVNVQLSRVPVGESIIPDAQFLWSYISNFWQLVEDRSVLTSIWSSVIQLVGAELIKLWSNDYNKSLKTIQSTFQRRWQQYSTETYLLDNVKQRVIVGYTADGSGGRSGTPGVIPGTGSTAGFYVPYGTTPPNEADFTQLARNYGIQGRVICINGEGYTLADAKTVEIEGSNYSLAIVDETAIPEGIIGATWRVPHVLHTPTTDLEAEGVRAGDVLVFEVTRSDANISTEVRAQVVCVDRTRLGFEFTLDDLETGSETLDRELFQQLVQELQIVSPSASDEQVSAAAESLISFVPQGVNLATRPFTGYRITLRAKKVIRNRVITVSEDVVSIPALQEQVVEPPVVLRENLDYVVEPGQITFISGLFTLKSPAPDQFWAENTVYDNADFIEANFGRLVDLGPDSLTEKRTRAPYLSAVKGLIFAYTNGPTIANIRLGLQILLGLPFTEERGVIIELNEEYTTGTSGVQLGRLLIEDVDNKNVRTGFRRLYFFPTTAGVEDHPIRGDSYRVGDVIEAFRPLSKGVEVTDYVKDPDWWKSSLKGLEVLKYFTFKVVTDSEVFDSNDAQFALEFIRKIKPAYADVINTILLELEDDTEVEDVLSGSILALFYDNPWNLEATNRADDYNHLGAVLFGTDGRRPYSTRSLTVLRDLETYNYLGQVRVRSETGFPSSLRVRDDTNDPHLREGDILYLFPGQPGAGDTTPGLYEIAGIADPNTILLGWEAPAGEFTEFEQTSLDADLFNFGSGLSGIFVRREINPIAHGNTLSVASGEIVTDTSATFKTDGVGPGDHLVIEEANDPKSLGEYVVSELPGTDPPDISETQLRLTRLYPVEGSYDVALDTESDIRYRIIRPILQRKNVPGIQTIWTGSERQLEAPDGGGGDGRLDVFTPAMVGMKIHVTGSQNPANDGVYQITGYVNRGAVTTDGGSTTDDTAAQATVHLGEERPTYFERITELHPVGWHEFALKGDPTVTNKMVITGATSTTSILTQSGNYTGGSWDFEGPADASSTPKKLGMQVGDWVHLTSSGAEQGAMAPIVSVGTTSVEVLGVLTVDSTEYEFELIRRTSL